MIRPHPDHDDLGPEEREVGADISGSTKHCSLPLREEHRHRRFRSTRSRQIFVERQIIDHRDAAAGKVELGHVFDR